MQKYTVEGVDIDSTSHRQSLDEADHNCSEHLELAQQSPRLRRRGAQSLSMEKSTPGNEGWVREQVRSHAHTLCPSIHSCKQ